MPRKPKSFEEAFPQFPMHRDGGDVGVQMLKDLADMSSLDSNQDIVDQAVATFRSFLDSTDRWSGEQRIGLLYTLLLSAIQMNNDMKQVLYSDKMTPEEILEEIPGPQRDRFLGHVTDLLEAATNGAGDRGTVPETLEYTLNEIGLGATHAALIIALTMSTRVVRDLMEKNHKHPEHDDDGHTTTSVTYLRKSQDWPKPQD